MTRLAHLMAAVLLTANLAPAPSLAANPVASRSADTELARYAEDLMRRNYAADGPGAVVLVARGDKVLVRAARGLADLERKVPLRPASRFRIGSVTKQFTAAGVLKLVEAGKVGLTDPLSKYVPDFPGGAEITVAELLNHTAGVTDYAGLPGYGEGAIRQDMSTAEVVGLFRDQPRDFAPGTRWAYSNSGYALLATVIERVTGKAWHAYLEEALFRPLKLTHTGYALDPRLAGREARGYSYRDGKVGPPLPMSMTQPSAAGALVSDVDDLFRWTRALHGGRVLGAAAYERMITPEGRAAVPGYGFGLYRGQVRTWPALRHGGRIFGFRAETLYLPGADVTVVVLENADAREGPDTPETLARRLAAMAAGAAYPEAGAAPVEAQALVEAEGAYRFGDGAVRTLRVENGRLTAQRDRGPRQLLTPVGPDDFLYPDGFNRLRLERDRGGKVVAARFFPGGDGTGEAGARTEIAAEAPKMTLSAAERARLVGDYASGGRVLSVFVEDDELKARLGDQESVTLRAMSPSRFEVEETGAVIEFDASDGPAAEAVIRQGARELVLRRR